MLASKHKAGGATPPATNGAPLIEMTGISKFYGKFQALKDMEFDLREGEVQVLFGENGAGKSTLIQIISGLQSFNSGTYKLFGQAVNPAMNQGRRHAGISVVFQEFSLVPEMTVVENIFLGSEITRRGRLSKSAMTSKVSRVLHELEFPIDPNAKVKDLRRAHQQMVEIAKALVHDCRVLVLDEPTASLTDQEAGHLFDIVERLRDNGLGIVYVSHRMAEIDRLANRITILRDGQYVNTVNNHEVDHQKLVELMTGRKFDKFFPHIERNAADPLLEFENVTLSDGSASNISFKIRAGEVLGLAGLAGCGKSEVIRSAFGLSPISEGNIVSKGRRLAIPHPRSALENHIIYFPADRSTEGLAMRQDIVGNSTMAALQDTRFSKFKSVLRRSVEFDFARNIVKDFNVRTPSIASMVDQLSGGNKQKIMLARGLSKDFEVFLFDEPTVGVDVQAKLEIYDFIKRLTEEGKAVVIASSELAEVLHMSHRLIVMQEGMIVGELEGGDIQEETVLSLFFEKSEHGLHAASEVLL